VAEEKELAAGMRTPRPALIARAAGDGRLDDDRVPRLDPGDGSADFFDDTRAFVPGDERIRHRVAADAAGQVIVEIAAANADGLAPDEDVVLADRLRGRGFADLDRPDAGEEGGSHGPLIIRQVVRIQKPQIAGRPPVLTEAGRRRIVLPIRRS
jgi:hypothetical protein